MALLPSRLLIFAGTRSWEVQTVPLAMSTPVRPLNLLEVLPMTGPKNLRERMEFPLALALSLVAGLLAFLLVRVASILFELYRPL